MRACIHCKNLECMALHHPEQYLICAVKNYIFKILCLLTQIRTWTGTMTRMDNDTNKDKDMDTEIAMVRKFVKYAKHLHICSNGPSTLKKISVRRNTNLYIVRATCTIKI
jgi:hypothetical protein